MLRTKAFFISNHLRRIYLNARDLFHRLYCYPLYWMLKTGSRCCVFIRGKHPVCGEPLFCFSANPDSLCVLCGFHIDHRSRSFLLQVSGVSSRLSFCCTSLVSGFIIHDKGGVVYSQSVQQMRRIFAPKIQKTGIHQLRQKVRAVCGWFVEKSEKPTADSYVQRKFVLS